MSKLRYQAMCRATEGFHRADHSMVAYDAKGRGDGDWHPTGQYAIDDLAVDLLHVREQFAGDWPVVAVGGSMGA